MSSVTLERVTSLVIALSNGYSDVVMWLIDNCNINLDSERDCLVDIAMQQGQLEILGILNERGIDVTRFKM